MFKFLQSFFDKPQSANTAKDRLQIIVSLNRSERSENGSDYLMKMKQELVSVIAKYAKVPNEQVHVHLDTIGDNDRLEINIELPERELTE